MTNVSISSLVVNRSCGTCTCTETTFNTIRRFVKSLSGSRVTSALYFTVRMFWELVKFQICQTWKKYVKRSRYKITSLRLWPSKLFYFVAKSSIFWNQRVILKLKDKIILTSKNWLPGKCILQMLHFGQSFSIVSKCNLLTW